MKNLYQKHGLVSRTYYKKSLIMASTFGSKSKSFMTMSIPSQDEPLTNQSVAVFEKLDDAPLCDTAGGPTAQMNFTSTDYHTKEELQSKGIKSPSNKKEVDEETEGETEEEEEDNPEHLDTFPTMKELRLDPKRKPSNPKKNCNFIGRVKGLRVFIGNFTYKCDFMVLKDTTSVIDHYFRSVVFKKPFVEATGLVYNKEEGTIVFERDKEMIIFKMPHKMDMFKHVDFAYRGTVSIPPFVIDSDDDNCEKTHYSNSLDLGPEYKYDEYVCRGI
ncbi:hypothetical protein Tco_1161349 [Tanacetum coccineum]